MTALLLAALVYLKQLAIEHHQLILGVLAYAALEWWLPRTDFFKAHSFIEGIANALKRRLLLRVPGLGRVIVFLATPAPTDSSHLQAGDASPPAAPPPNGQAGKVNLAFMVAVGLGTALVLSLCVGCAHRTDAIRDACSEADNKLAATYETSTTIYRADQKALRDKLTVENVDQVQQTAAAHDAAFGKLIALLDTIRASKVVVCAFADAIDAGANKDIAAVIGQVVQLGVDVAAAVAAFQKALDEFDISAAARLVA
jgi:hypothetical protein